MYDTGHLKAPSLTHSPTHPIEEHNEEILAWTLGKFNHQKLNNIYILLVLTICTCLSDGSSCLMVSPPVRRRRVRYLTIHVTGGSLVCTTHLQYRIPLCRFLFTEIMTATRAGCRLLPASRTCDIICYSDNEMLRKTLKFWAFCHEWPNRNPISKSDQKIRNPFHDCFWWFGD